jgi:glycosyltransferase involved in cell wall biosynthesis
VHHTIKELAPDIVLAWGAATLRYTAVATATSRGAPPRGYVAIGSPSAWVRSRAQRARYRGLTSRYRFVIAVSEHTRDELVGFIGVPAPRVHVVRSGIPAAYLDVESSQRGPALRVLVAGSLSEEKDPLAALEASATVAATLPVTLRFLGEGPLRGRLEDEAQRLGVSQSVELSGAAADVRPHLAWADVLLLTSRTEGLPGIVIEAAAAGVPAVAYDVGAVDEIVEDGESGLLVPSRSPAGAAEALTRLAADAGLRARYGSRARRIAANRFLIADTAALLDRVLRAQLS